MSNLSDNAQIKTVTQFGYICEEFSIYPPLALEDETLQDRLCEGMTVKELRAFLTDNF